MRVKPPAAFRRLCVETLVMDADSDPVAPAAFRRLCVETKPPNQYRTGSKASRLQAAVC